MREGHWWLTERYIDPLPIRSQGAFHIVSAKRSSDGAPAVVVIPGPRADRARVADVLAEVERVHALIDHPMIPGVMERAEADGVPYLAFACDAMMDGTQFIRVLAESGGKMPYAEGDTLICCVREALQAAQSVVDPRTGRPICIGRLAYGNLLYARNGAVYVVGFGKNFVVESEDGSLDGSAPLFQAPEIAVGAPPSPSGDYVALLHVMRSLLPYVEPPEALARIFKGELTPDDFELLNCLRWFEQRVVGEAAAARASVDEAVEMSARVRVLLGTRLEREGLRQRIIELLEPYLEPYDDPRLLEATEEAAPSAPEVGLTIGPEVAWIESPAGTRYPLLRAHRRIVDALVKRHGEPGAKPLTTWELVEVGWPDEPQVVYEAGVNRVYVTLARLKKRGFEGVIERFDDGYRIAPNVVVRRV